VASQAELEQVRRTLNALSQAAQNDMGAVWDSLGAGDRALVGQAMSQGWAWVLERYGNMASTLGGDFFEVQAAELGVRRPKAILAPAMDEDRAMARLGWAVSTEDQLGNMMGLLDELVKQPYRSTMQDSAHASGLAWARVPVGPTTCKWCVMLAGRGAVYHSKELALLGTNGKKYHGDCNCAPTLVRGPQDYPEGYDPAALFEQYEAGRAQAGSGDPHAIVAAMREQSGTH
jgi:hypothetical protein